MTEGTYLEKNTSNSGASGLTHNLYGSGEEQQIRWPVTPEIVGAAPIGVATYADVV